MAKKIFFIILILVGIFLRIYKIDQIPAGLFMDEATIAVDSKSIAENGIDEYGRKYPFVFEALSDQRPPGYVYLTSLAYLVLGNSIITIKIVSLISSIIGIFLLGYLAKILFPEKKYLPLITMSVLAISPFHIHFARIGYETMLATSLITIFYISLIKVFNKPKLGWYLTGAIAASYGLWTYPGVKFIIPFTCLVFLTLGTLGINFGLKKRNIIFSSLFFLILSFFVYIPALLNPVFDKRPISYIKEGTDGTLIGVLTKKPLLMLNSWLYMFDFNFLFKRGDLFAFRHGTKEQGLFFSIFAIPFFLGIIQSVRNLSSKSFAYSFLIILAFVIGIPSALTSNTPYGTRILPILIPFSIFISLGINFLIERVKKINLLARTFISLTVLGILLFQTLLFYHIYFSHFKTTSLPEFSKAQRDLAYFIKDEMKNTKAPIYFLAERSCRKWSHDDLYLWYFADLDSQKMSKWNLEFRKERYKEGSPFDAYDTVKIPSFQIDNLLLYQGFDALNNAPSGSVITRCGLHLADIDKEKEKIIKVYYMYEEGQRDPYYVVSKKL